MVTPVAELGLVLAWPQDPEGFPRILALLSGLMLGKKSPRGPGPRGGVKGWVGTGWPGDQAWRTGAACERGGVHKPWSPSCKEQHRLTLRGREQGGVGAEDCTPGGQTWGLLTGAQQRGPCGHSKWERRVEVGQVLRGNVPVLNSGPGVRTPGKREWGQQEEEAWGCFDDSCGPMSCPARWRKEAGKPPKSSLDVDAAPSLGGGSLAGSTGPLQEPIFAMSRAPLPTL